MSRTETEETSMARTGSTPPTDAPEADPVDIEGKKVKEKEVDYMADAPPERPYADAISDEHREVLEASGLVVPEASKK